MKRKTKHRAIKRERKTRTAPRVAIVPASSKLRLGSHAVTSDDVLAKAEEIAATLKRVLPEKGFIKDFGGKLYVKAHGWAFCGALLGIAPVEELCERLTGINGYRAVVRLERICDGKMVGRASAVCSLNEPSPVDFSTEEFATYSKTITRATGKAYRLTYGWIMRLAGFEDSAADEIFEVEGSQSDADTVAQQKIEKKLGRKFPTLAHAEAAALEERERKKEAKRWAFISWPNEHNHNRFLLGGRDVIFDKGLWNFVTEACQGAWSDRAEGWFIAAGFVEQVRQRLTAEGIKFQEHAFSGDKPILEALGLDGPQAAHPEADHAS